MTVVEIIIADLHRLSNGGHRVGLCVRVNVAVNVVCAGQQCTGETCIRTRYRTPTHSGRQRRSSGNVISTANAILQHLTHVTSE